MKINSINWILPIICLGISSCNSGGGSSSAGGGGVGYPYLTPPVKAAAPVGFGGTGMTSTQFSSFSAASSDSLDTSDFQSRFFSTGPTNIFSILEAIDNRISGINNSTNSATCLTQTPVAYTINAFYTSATPVTMYAQCYQSIGSSFSGDPGFVQWGVQNGTFYLWTAIGQSWTAAIATPIANSSQYSVQAWVSVGIGNFAASSCSNEWDNCSYGVMQILANPVTQKFEMSVAGIGFGYCGAQYTSDGSVIYGAGSVDQGTCNTLGTICVEANNLSQSATCNSPGETTFSLPALGREAVVGQVRSWGVSLYPSSPGSGNVLLNGASSTDAVHFGPTTPTPGVGNYSGS